MPEWLLQKMQQLPATRFVTDIDVGRQWENAGFIGPRVSLIRAARRMLENVGGMLDFPA